MCLYPASVIFCNGGNISQLMAVATWRRPFSFPKAQHSPTCCKAYRMLVGISGDSPHSCSGPHESRSFVTSNHIEFADQRRICWPPLATTTQHSVIHSQCNLGIFFEFSNPANYSNCNAGAWAWGSQPLVRINQNTHTHTHTHTHKEDLVQQA